jgi:Transcriptional regulator
VSPCLRGGFWQLAGKRPRYLTAGHFLTDSHSSMAAPAPAFQRRRRRYNDVRDRILNAAVELFARRGIVHTRVESITEAADVAKGTFFNYFPTKEAIAAELAKRLMTDLWIVAQRARTADSVRPILEALPDVSSTPCMAARFFAAACSDRSCCTTRLPPTLPKSRHRRSRIWSYILERGQELGEVRTDRAAADIALALQQALWGALAGVARRRRHSRAHAHCAGSLLEWSRSRGWRRGRLGRLTSRLARSARSTPNQKEKERFVLSVSCVASFFAGCVNKCNRRKARVLARRAAAILARSHTMTCRMSQLRKILETSAASPPY